MQYLLNTHKLAARGRHLDYGCGKGQDADRLGMDKFDPHFFPELPGAQYTTITCNYVLNVVEDPATQVNIINHIRELLTEDGKAYVTVRADVKVDGPTSKGWQGTVTLNFPIVKKTSGYTIYRVTK